MTEGLTEAVVAAVIPSMVFTILIAGFSFWTLDEEGTYWYFISALVGGIVAIVIAFFISSSAAQATVRTAWKARLTLKYSYKVAHRTGMSAMFFATGTGILSILILFALLEDWYGENKPEKMFDTAQVLWPFALTTATVGVFFRISGIIYERTTNVGEVLIAHGSECDHYMKHPASTTYNVGQLAGSLVGTTLDYYGLFVVSLVACLTFGTTSPEIIAQEGAIYYPLLYSGMIINVCLVVCLLVNFIELADLTEDHYYVENSSRMVLILALIILAPMTFLLHGVGLPDTLTAGVAGFEVFEVKEAIDSRT